VRVTPECDTIDSTTICNRADSQFGPAIAFDGANYVVVWSDRRFTGNYWWVTAARVTPQGVLLDTGNIIGAGDAHNEFYADIAFDGARCFVVWYHSYYAPYGIYGRFLNGSAQPEDSVIPIAPALTHVLNCAKVASGAEKYLVVWADQNPAGSDYDIYGQLIATDGQLIGSRITIATGANDQTRPDVEFVGQEYLAVWVENGLIRGQWIDQQGQLAGAPIAVSETTANPRDYPRLCAQGDRYFAVWSELRGASSDIYGRLGAAQGIGEETNAPGRLRSSPETVFLNALPGSPVRSGLGIYDCLGRRLASGHAPGGVYFVVDASGRLKKVLTLR
jgi:hypothetical protein